jgi:hypothetical protein
VKHTSSSWFFSALSRARGSATWRVLRFGEIAARALRDLSAEPRLYSSRPTVAARQRPLTTWRIRARALILKAQVYGHAPLEPHRTHSSFCAIALGVLSFDLITRVVQRQYDHNSYFLLVLKVLNVL